MRSNGGAKRSEIIEWGSSEDFPGNPKRPPHLAQLTADDIVERDERRRKRQREVLIEYGILLLAVAALACFAWMNTRLK